MEMAKQREFSTLSSTQNMNIWKTNLNSLPTLVPKQTIFPTQSWFSIFSGILIYLLTLQTLSTLVLTGLHRFAMKTVLIPPVFQFVYADIMLTVKK